MGRLYKNTGLSILETNVADSALDEWTSGASYTLGDEIKLTTDQPVPHHAFRAKSTHTASSANAPTIGGNTTWTDLGAINKHAMFDRLNNSRTVADTGDGGIAVAIEPPLRGNKLALLGLRNVERVNVRQYANGTDTPVLTSTSHDLATWLGDVGWWTWLFEEPSYQQSIIIALPGLYNQPRVEIDLIGATAECAQCLHINDFDIGITADGAGPRVVSYSSFEPDEFGNYRFTPRKNTRSVTFTAKVKTADFNRVWNLLESVENELVLVDANNEASACGTATDIDAIRVWGKLTDVRPGIEYEDTLIDFTVEGTN